MPYAEAEQVNDIQSPVDEDGAEGGAAGENILAGGGGVDHRHQNLGQDGLQLLHISNMKTRTKELTVDTNWWLIQTGEYVCARNKKRRGKRERRAKKAGKTLVKGLDHVKKHMENKFKLSHTVTRFIIYIYIIIMDKM